jgi:hypothetical protein
MRRALATAFAFAVIAVLAAPAATATPSPKAMAGQIRTLQKQVTTLQKTVRKLTTTLGQTQVVAIGALLYGGCTSAATADALQGGNPTLFGTTAVNDYNACSDLSKFTSTTIARQPNTATVNVFQSLLNIFKPS